MTEQEMQYEFIRQLEEMEVEAHRLGLEHLAPGIVELRKKMETELMEESI